MSENRNLIDLIENLHITTTGSFPKEFYEPDHLESAIIQAIELQQKHALTLLVDGQFRADIVGLFAAQIGLHGKQMPYKVKQKITIPQESSILSDLKIAAKYRQTTPLKAHLTGPTVLAEGCIPEDEGLTIYPKNADGLKQLTFDIAHALAQEARWLGEQADALGLAVLQIDEPTLAYGADLETARTALKIIADAWHAAAGEHRPILLHICGDCSAIWDDLLKMPVTLLNVESNVIEALTPEQHQQFSGADKKLALGCVPVNTANPPDEMQIVQDILLAFERLGDDALWGLTPVCGLRQSSQDLAEKRLKVLRSAKNLLPRILAEGVDAS